MVLIDHNGVYQREGGEIDEGLENELEKISLLVLPQNVGVAFGSANLFNINFISS